MHKKITVDYKDGGLEYSVWYLPLWDWCLELLSDPHLVSKFTWDAQQVYKYNGHVFERIYHEPWTGEAWWKFEVSNSCLSHFHLMLIYCRAGHASGNSEATLYYYLGR